MSAETLVDAFRLGGRRNYKGTDLGHFGIGLKAASMRQASSLTVYSAVNVDAGLCISGARLNPEDSPDGTLGIRILDQKRAEFGYAFGYESDPPESGTVVEWAGIRTVSDAASQETRQEWLDRRLESTRAYLGLVFHRILEAGDLRIEIDIFEVAGLFAGVPRRIEPINPFGYQLSGRSGFPRPIEGALPDGSPILAICHILPPKGVDRGLPGKREDWQGLYVYRNNRLLTVNAGWQGLAVPKSDLRLARVAIEIDDKLLQYVMPHPEKNGVVLHPDYSKALQVATEPQSGISFTSFLDESRAVWKESTKRTAEKPLTKIAEGFPAPLLQQLGESFGWRSDHSPVSVVWEEIARDDIFRIDLDRRLLVMNSAHSVRFGGEDSPQATLVVTLLYLLVEANFTRASHLRATTHYHLEQINGVLLTALYSADGADPMGPPVLRSIPADALAKLRASISVPTSRPDPDQPSITVQEEVGSIATGAYTSNSPSIHEDILDAAIQEEPADLEPQAAKVPVTAPKPDRGLVLRTPQRFGPSDPLDADDIASFEAYCEGAGIGEISAALGREKDSVARSLTLALFGAEAVDDDESLAPFHGLPYTPDERERIVKAYRSDGSDSIVEIARDNSRTPLAIAWLLLDSPKRPVRVDKRVRKNVRRRFRTNDDRSAT